MAEVSIEVGGNTDEARVAIRNSKSWRHKENCETYLGLFDLLLLHMSVDDALGILSQAYLAAANEYLD